MEEPGGTANGNQFGISDCGSSGPLRCSVDPPPLPSVVPGHNKNGTGLTQIMGQL
jgi:hypothetical protein